MPLFEYRCSDCQAEFEALVGREETEPVACEKCKGTQTERIASTFSCCSSDKAAPLVGGGGC